MDQRLKRNADYGSAILKPGLLHRHPRVKNRLMSRVQYSFLDFFGWLANRSNLDRPLARFARRVIGPYLYSLKVEVNTACELKCRFCYVRDKRSELDSATAIQLLRQLNGCGVRLEVLGGEPLMWPHLCGFVHRAKRESRVPFVTLYSNGIRADRDYARRLARAGLDAAIISLFSPQAEVHDRLTGVAGSSERTREGIANLRDAGIAVYTFTPVHRLNHRDCQAMYDLVRNELRCRPLFYQYVPQVKDDELLIPNEEWRQIKHWVLMEKNRRHMDFVRRFYMLTGNACSGGNFVLTVKADGSVQPCPFVDDMPLGNVHEESLWTIYRRRYDRPEYLEFKSTPAACADCSYRSVCGGGCRAANRMYFGSYCRPDMRCLGPFAEPIAKDEIIDHVPTFF